MDAGRPGHRLDRARAEHLGASVLSLRGEALEIGGIRIVTPAFVPGNLRMGTGETREGFARRRRSARWTGHDGGMSRGQRAWCLALLHPLFHCGEPIDRE